MSWRRGSQDRFYGAAKRRGYRSRSAMKLLEIAKYGKPKPGDAVLDLGCSPGGWSQILSEAVGPKGKVVGIDTVDPHLSLPNFTFVQADMRQLVPGLGPFASIYCDASPKFIGVRDVDMARAQELWLACVNWCDETLEDGGTLVMKAFQSRELEEVRPQLEKRFDQIKFFRPTSSRKGSSEVYLLCYGFKRPERKREGSSAPGSNLIPCPSKWVGLHRTPLSLSLESTASMGGFPPLTSVGTR